MRNWSVAGSIDRQSAHSNRQIQAVDLRDLLQEFQRCLSGHQEFAANGQVKFQYSIDGLGTISNRACEWHLKDGDHTTRECAARVYFDRVELLSGRTLVIVFYCGPHPPEGTRRIAVKLG
jgi:hypothetical protein